MGKFDLCAFCIHDGKTVETEFANISIVSHTINFGTGIFESIRVYDCLSGDIGILALNQHLIRLKNSVKLIGYDTEIDIIEIESQVINFINLNNIKNGYIRILVYPNKDGLGFSLENTSPVYSIFGWKMELEDVDNNSISLGISSYRRPDPITTMPYSKVCGLYVMDTIAHNEQTRCGFDEALLLNVDGSVCEAAGAHIFCVKNGIIFTPTITNTIKGITREIVFDICKDTGIECIEKPLILDDLFLADEVFLTGTFHGIKPVNKISNIKIGNPNTESIQKQIYKQYQNVANNQHRTISSKWLKIL